MSTLDVCRRLALTLISPSRRFVRKVVISTGAREGLTRKANAVPTAVFKRYCKTETQETCSILSGLPHRLIPGPQPWALISAAGGCHI
jgi:hypothetical protein